MLNVDGVICTFILLNPAFLTIFENLHLAVITLIHESIGYKLVFAKMTVGYEVYCLAWRLRRAFIPFDLLEKFFNITTIHIIIVCRILDFVPLDWMFFFSLGSICIQYYSPFKICKIWIGYPNVHINYLKKHLFASLISAYLVVLYVKIISCKTCEIFIWIAFMAAYGGLCEASGGCPWSNKTFWSRIRD